MDETVIEEDIAAHRRRNATLVEHIREKERNVLVMGATVNLVLAVALFSASFMHGVQVPRPSLPVMSPVETPAAEAPVPEKTVGVPTSFPAQIAVPLPPAFGGKGWEQILVENWLVWLGGVALALGGAFLVKLSIDYGLLTPAVRVALGLLLGLALWAGAEWIVWGEPAAARPSNGRLGSWGAARRASMASSVSPPSVPVSTRRVTRAGFDKAHPSTVQPPID